MKNTVAALGVFVHICATVIYFNYVNFLFVGSSAKQILEKMDVTVYHTFTMCLT